MKVSNSNNTQAVIWQIEFSRIIISFLFLHGKSTSFHNIIITGKFTITLKEEEDNRLE